jgi:signal transduction histidine kinase
MNLSLRNKTIMSIALIEAVLLIFLIFTAVNFMRNTLNEDLAKRSSTIATLFASTTKNAVLTYDLASLETYCTELMKNPDIAYVRLVNSNNQVLAEAGDKSLLTRPFIQDEQVNMVTDGIFDNFADIKESHHVYGRVELGIDISNIKLSIKKIQNWTTIIALIEMLLVALFSFVLGSYLTRQLQTLRIAAREVSRDIEKGNFNHAKLPVNGTDELAEVTHAFNKLIATLETEHARTEEYQKDLKILNHTLEEKVKQRTSLLNQRNEQLQESNQELHAAQKQLVHAEKMASIGQLAAGIAHEINNPIGFVSSNLNTLQVYTATYSELSKQVQLLLTTESLEEKNSRCKELMEWLNNEDLSYIDNDTSELLNESIEGLARVSDIAKGLKQFSRADSDEKNWFDINECAITTLKIVNNKLKYHCTVHQNLAELPPLWINFGKISQVLTNLLINAAQAIDGEGEIFITTALESNNVVISIEDTGSGISQDNLNKIFDPFFTTKDVGLGTGLGLSISYGIIQEHGGSITVSSELNNGTCFKVTLPIKEQRNAKGDINA